MNKYLRVLVLLPLISVSCTSGSYVNKDVQKEAQKTVDVKVDESRLLFGPAQAPVTIVKYADFQCPACSMDVGSLENVKKKYGDKVRFIHKHMPLDFHPQAKKAAEIFEALLIMDKEKAQKFYAEAYASNRSWNSEKDLWAIVKKIGANEKQITTEIKKGTVETRIQQDIAEHHALGFQGTPAYMINGQSLYGAQRTETFVQVIEASLRK